MTYERLLAGTLLLTIGALIMAACGDDDGYGSAAATAATTTAANSSGASGEVTVKVATTSKGATLTDKAGLTLYIFDKDSGGKSACTASCAGAWPALTITGGAKPSGLPSGLDTIARDDGAKQVTFNGHPLYRFSGDKVPGDTTGDGVGGTWHVATQTLGATDSSTAAAGAGGYNY